MIAIITLHCDHCGAEIPVHINGGVRVRTGKTELSLQLCGPHQQTLRDFVNDFCGSHPPKEVTPSLRKP